MTIKEIQEKIVAELRDKVSAGEFSENDAVAYWSDETGVYAYSLERKRYRTSLFGDVNSRFD